MRGSSTAFLLKATGLFFSYLFNLYMARVYGASVVGLLAFAVTVASIFALLGQMGTQTSTIRLVSGHKARGSDAAVREVYRRILSMVMPAAIVIGGAMLLFGIYAAPHLFNERGLTSAILVLSATIPFLVLGSVNASTLRGLKRIFPSYFFQGVLTPLLNLILLIGLTILWAKNNFLPIAAHTISVILAALVSSFILWRTLTAMEKGIASQVESRRQILAISLPMMLSASLLLIMSWVDIIMLGVMKDTAAVGYYRIAQRLSMLTSLSLLAVNGIVAPKISELYVQNKFGQLRQTVRYAARLIFWTSLPVLLLLIIFAEPILRIFGADFIVAAGALVVLSLGQLVNSSCGSVGLLLDMTKHQNVFRNILGVAAVVNLVLNLVLIPKYGILGAAIATAVSMSLWNLIASGVVFRLFGFWAGYFPKYFRLNEEG